MLATLVGGEKAVAVQADDITEALEALFGVHPQLRVHVLDESGTIRPHVSCFHNDELVTDVTEERSLALGDTVTILQAVSGGAAPA